MGREVRRVPLDFDWPLDKIWPGFTFRADLDYVGGCSCPEPWRDKESMCAFHRAEWDFDGLIELPVPTGDGWQLWETVSEGSPISPVFANKEGLIDWLCSPAYARGISGPMQREQAERFVDSGWAPTMVFSPSTGLVAGENFNMDSAGQSGAVSS